MRLVSILQTTPNLLYLHAIIVLLVCIYCTASIPSGPLTSSTTATPQSEIHCHCHCARQASTQTSDQCQQPAAPDSHSSNTAHNTAQNQDVLLHAGELTTSKKYPDSDEFRQASPLTPISVQTYHWYVLPHAGRFMNSKNYPDSDPREASLPPLSVQVYQEYMYVQRPRRSVRTRTPWCEKAPYFEG